MALGATIFKAALQVADMDRNYYGDHPLTIARHPSETDERMMVRLLAFALHAHARLEFGRGLSSEDEPDLWRMDLTGSIERWIEVGLPDVKRLRRACGRARRVYVYGYGGRTADMWWERNGDDLARHANLVVVNVPRAASQALARMAQRSMALQFNLQDGAVWVGDDRDSASVELVAWKSDQEGSCRDPG
jgi:uncharacterized protein YaeQ